MHLCGCRYSAVDKKYSGLVKKIITTGLVTTNAISVLNVENTPDFDRISIAFKRSPIIAINEHVPLMLFRKI